MGLLSILTGEGNEAYLVCVMEYILGSRPPQGLLKNTTFNPSEIRDSDC